MNKRENEIHVVKLPEYVVRERSIVYYKNWGEVESEEFADFLPREKKLSKEEVHLYAILWSEFMEDNSPLRALVNGRVLGDIIGHFPISVGDWWYAKRIESYIGQGKIHIIEDSEKKYARMICMRKECDFMTELKEMKNIGTEIEKKLKSVGIETAEELTQLGGKEAFVRLKMRYPNVCLVHLYTLQGAIDNMEYNQLPEDVKQDLKSFSDGFK